MNEAEALSQAKTFLLDQKEYYGATYIQISKDDRNVYIGAICHSMFVDKRHPLAYGSQCLIKWDDVVGNRFWEFVTNDRVSPWRKILPHIQEVRSSFGLHGFVLDSKSLKDLPFGFVKNFCILSRVINEKRLQFDFWNLCVEQGMDPRDAFYLCSFFQYQRSNRSITPAIQSSILGGHWPITDTNLHRFSWDRFRSGDIPQYSSSINGYFEGSQSDYTPFEPYAIPQSLMKTTFSVTNSYEYSVIADSFYKWQNAMKVRV